MCVGADSGILGVLFTHKSLHNGWLIGSFLEI
jgi:hypothetical protein